VNPEAVLNATQQALTVALLLAAPLLLAALAVGLVVSVLQAATQINEMTLSFIPKLLALVAALILAGPWMLQIVTDYARSVFGNLNALVG
jgi:flagellar biosynthetic protein FliQ